MRSSGERASRRRKDPSLVTTHAQATSFIQRHIGPDQSEIDAMLHVLGYDSLDALTSAAVPRSIADNAPLNLPEALSEYDTLNRLRQLADTNIVKQSMIGLGYYPTVTPGVIARNILENPRWYTAYTPYQPEISQGRLEALLNFQTMVCDLTGMQTANASMLDEATAAAEAVALMRRRSKANADAVLLVDENVMPQTLAVVTTRARAIDVPVKLFDPHKVWPSDVDEVFGVLVQYPNARGEVYDLTEMSSSARSHGAMVTVAADLLALTVLTEPGQFGVDVVVGTTQRFGVPMGFGGPHAGYMAVRDGLERALPGRLVGVSVDADGKPAYRLALQTREQHIRRQKATSNICTAQVLLAVMASMYAVYHGPAGLRKIAQTITAHAHTLRKTLEENDIQCQSGVIFDTVTCQVDHAAAAIERLSSAGYLAHHVDDHTLSVSCDETTTADDVRLVAAAIVGRREITTVEADVQWPDQLQRSTSFLDHEVFNTHHSETKMLRYITSLGAKDYALDQGMIPLGSCTMKLNATTEMESVTWPQFSQLHPFAPPADASGTKELIAELEQWLCEITGYDAVSVQPNAGSQGEFAGLLAIRSYHIAQGQPERDVCLIPTSAHGTNPASAVMAGLKVVPVNTDDFGNIDITHLKSKVEEHRETLAAIMVTYPSTHGVYEESITDVCAIVHDAGGQVYVDGANLNALVGLAKPGKFGADVSHLNLHKTFCIPHGGGGPGVGPVGVRRHLAEFLPASDTRSVPAPGTVGPISAAPYGSAAIMQISWAYIAMMGAQGLRQATQVAVASANYIAHRLSDHYPILYTGNDNLVAHECIVDVRPLAKETGITVDDVAKRLIDYGFHAPTMSFPVAGTLMIEPTESEDLAEIDRFCDAMIAIRAEAQSIADGVWPADNNPLVNAPHTAAMLAGEWPHPYSRTVGCFPEGMNPASKYWSPVRRVDNVYGDRNLVCSCLPMESYIDSE